MALESTGNEMESHSFFEGIKPLLIVYGVIALGFIISKLVRPRNHVETYTVTNSIRRKIVVTADASLPLKEQTQFIENIMAWVAQSPFHELPTGIKELRVTVRRD